MLSQELKSKITRLWDKFWARGITNPITAIEQISYLLFIRRLEEIDNKKLEDSQKTKERYTSIFKNRSKLKWSYIKTLPGKEMLEIVNSKVFPFIKTLNKPDQPFSRHMNKAVFIINNPTLLKEAVQDIDDIYTVIEKQQNRGQNFQDTQGDVYEHLLGETKEAGKNGQFRTPRHIIQMICEIVDPDIKDNICDLACGTGGFLLGAYQHILTRYTSDKFKVKDENGFLRGIKGDEVPNVSNWRKLKESTFYGFDIDQTMVRIGLMNLMLHDISIPKIENVDTLTSNYDSYENDEKYSIIMANPPFTGRIDTEAKSAKFRVNTKQSELLFIDRIIHMLKPKGKAAVVVPEGVLFNSGKAYMRTRELLLKDCVLDAVISLPAGVFKPYTNVKTAILFFTKNKLNNEDFSTQKVWFYELNSDGYSLDDNRKRLNDEPLPQLINDWKNREKSKPSLHHFHVSIDEICKYKFDLTINTYKPFDYEPQEYIAPKNLLKDAIILEQSILSNLKKLSELIDGI